MDDRIKAIDDLVKGGVVNARVSVMTRVSTNTCLLLPVELMLGVEVWIYVLILYQ